MQVRSRLFPWLAAVALACLPSCGGDAPAPAARPDEVPGGDVARRAVPSTAPDARRPFTEAELRAGLRVGLEVVYDVVGRHDPPEDERVYTSHEVVAVDEAGVTVEVTTLDAGFEPMAFREGTLENPRRTLHSWSELADRHAWERGSVVVTEETLETAGRRFPCRHFDLGADEAGWSEHLWFSREVPGLPIRIEQRGRHGPILTRSVVRWTPPPAR